MFLSRNIAISYKYQLNLIALPNKIFFYKKKPVKKKQEETKLLMYSSKLQKLFVQIKIEIEISQDVFIDTISFISFKLPFREEA